MTNGLLYSKKDGIATIIINRPEKYNAITREVAMAMQKSLDDANEDETIRVVVLTANGKAFCAGQDLPEALDDNGLEIGDIVREHYNPIILKITQLNKPVVAAVNGVAAGAGANIALACDIVVANASASFIQAFSKIGLIPDSGGTYFLPRIIGHQKATALMMLGDKVSAEDAEKMGMIYKCFSNETFEEEVNKIATTLSQMPTKGLAMTKKVLLMGRNNDLESQLKIEQEYQTAAGETYDYKEGTSAFVEKRKANFKGA